MPSTRRPTVRENWRKRTRPSPVLESEPQDLRVVTSRVVMDQNVETNGCEDGPISLAVSNHNDVAPCATKTDKPMAKSLSTQEGKKPRQTSTNAKGNRARRNPPSNPPNSTPSASPPSERRATRNLPPPPSPTKQVTRTPTAAERKAIKNTAPIPAVNTQSSGKKAAHPPTLSPQVAGAAPVLSQEAPVAPPSNSRLAKSAQQSQLHSSPPLLKSQKRNLKRQSDVSELDGSSGRASKRVRLQHQPFQSPPPPSIIPAILRQQVIKTPEDKIVVFHKGEFLAVRNENGSFFVCRTAQNVYKSSKRFKIQWMSDKESDIYIPDFYDQTDFECVLTNLRLKRVDKNKFMLPSEERQRTLNILQRALNVENGMDISPLQVTTDGVDVSIVGKEDEEILKLQQENLKNEQKNKISQLRNRAATRAANRGRPKRPEPVAKVTRASASADTKSKTLAAKVKLRARETVKVKLKKEGGRIIVSNKAGKPVTKLKKIAERLHPNPKVTVFEKDPTFETNIQIPYVSSSAHSKLLIRAILLKDIAMLQSLMKDTQKICSLNTYRSVDVQLTPLMYAVLNEDHKAIRALLTVNKRKYANPPETLLEYQRTGRYNMTMLGHAVKAINVSRGGKEGNNAFLKDIEFCEGTYPSVNQSVFKEALKAGVSMDTINLLMSDEKEDPQYSYRRVEILRSIHVAIRNGHHKLAGQLVSEAVDKGGYGFNNLHKEVLVNDRQPLSAFKSVSVIKKALCNARITPLHCAAINPNPQYLTALLTSSPEYNIPDENGWRPIHYASVCKSTGPLELLISRSISLEEPESEGNAALQIAALVGRAHNVDLILRHLIASEHNKKETAITVSLQDKQCVNAIDKGNKKSYTALHIACQEGHTDVVRVLIRHKANVDKMTNAQHDKLTPLMFASQKGHLEVVKLLIEHNAQVEMKDKKQRTALTHAVINGHAHVTSYLLRLGANPNSTDSSGNTLVHYAAAYGWYFCLKLLIEAGASLNLPNDWKITPLSLAFMKGHMGLVDFLVEQPGIDINVDVNNESGMTLVMQALRSNINHSMLERIHFLVVKQKSDCTKVDFMGNNAFHHLVLAEVSVVHYETKAQQEHDALIQEITKLLLDHGCDPMVRNKEGESPFNLAVKEGCLLLVKMFLDAGCELNLDVSQSGDNILHYLVAHARNRKVEPMLQAILNAKCSNPETTPHQLLCQMAKMFNKNGHTPLLQALYTLGSCHVEESINRLLTFTKFLLDELGADISAPCKNEDGEDGSYALHLGTKCKGGGVIEVLLAHKPPLNVFDEKGQSPLTLAIKEENTEAVEALETLVKDWQGILYLMLDQIENAEKEIKGISVAVEAALRTAKYNVALKLIGTIKNNWQLYNDKQSLLHILASEAPIHYLPELQNKVAHFLTEKGVPVLTKDEHGSIPLTYASMNMNHTLCSHFCSKVNISVACKVSPDDSLRTPLTALFWFLTSEDLPEEMKNWLGIAVKNGVSINELTRYPIAESPYPGVRCTILNLFHVPEGYAAYPPLIMAIYKANYSVVKLLLNRGSDVNFPDSNLKTPLMHAARLNDMKMVKLLLNFNYDPSKDKNPYRDVEPGTFQKTSTANLAARDNKGWTVVHYIVNPMPDYCYANTSLLNFLAELGAPLDTVNNDGESPLQMATRLQRKVLVTALQKLLNTPEDQKIKIELSLPVPPSDDIQWDQPISSYVEDSKLYLEKLENEQMDTGSQLSVKPDPLSNFEVNGEIVMDTEKDIPYDIVMTVVDLNYGAYGIYNFYKMQVIKHIEKDLFILFTCWGRVGDTGQHQKTPFNTQAEAVKEFCRIFRAKSGNNWDDVKNFQPQPKKYRLVQLERKKFSRQLKLKLSLKSDIPSKLSEPKQKLIESLMDIHTIEDTLKDLGVDSTFDILPFGSLTMDTLVKAEKILKEIRDVIAEKDNLRQNVKSQEKFAELMHKIVKLSEEFYQLLPVYGFAYEKLCPLFSPPDVHSKLKLIHNLQHIGLSSQLILGASLKFSEINPKDYVYRSLNCNLNLLDPKSQEAQMILQYIHNTCLSNNVEVQSIYAVHLPEQFEHFKSLKLSNHMLLWHGTRLSNMLAILARGLQVAPLGVQMNGDLFGKGIYFADMFKKSQNYCVQHYSSKVKSILLCEVALGDIKEVDYNLVVDPAEKYDSVKAVGHRQPDPSQTVYWKGMTVPIGTPVNVLEQGTSTSHHYLNFNEYVVYNASQVCIRYLIQFTD
ncbi:poly polymerase tankyrase [Trichonephila inaurata madagascariensis]|uniref:Poly [ADP-ribose] polymerase n=1 Tax=Trichonephila inaurata madagascariensis TaxID=2747483 RepID=A0A8X6YJR2_9ARAC|nr:poly polymerase tankyrase [Trichonephila inaurata madagascariensis]